MAVPNDSSSTSPADLDTLVAQAAACRQGGRLGEAARLFALALERAPSNPTLLLLAGETLYRLGRLFSACKAVAAALKISPGNAEAEFLLGRILTGLGWSADSVAAFERALALRADNAAAWRFMAPALYVLGRIDKATAAFDRADALQPETADFYNQLGIDLLGQRRHVEAEAAFRHAVKIAPHLAAAHQNLGAVLAAQERLKDALAAERRATELAPQSAAAWNNRAVFEGSSGDFEAARRSVRRALEIDADHPDALNTLAQIRLEEGDAAAAVDLVRRVVARQPAHRAAGGALLMNQLYIASGRNGAALVEAKAIAGRLRPEGPPFSFQNRDRDPLRALRIGYVSGDFRQHSCASFIKPLFAAHDRDTVEIVAYSENTRDDQITDAIRATTRAWHSIAGLGDAAVAELVHRDRIDILVDLSGHTAGNRLPVFALKPAPIQVTWLGYPSTTGLADIDYRLTDDRADPPGSGADEDYTERLWRVPECFLVYAADPAAPPVLGRDESSPVTFGSFNHLPKVTPETVAAWAQILNGVPGSRLIMKAKRLGDPEVSRRYATLFAGHGIGADRLELIGWQAAPADHLALYRRIDVALDPFPYNGTTTTCEALWMGVPVITLAGDRHAGRVGVSLLRAVGLDRLVAPSRAAYVEYAIALARAADERTMLRASLRDRVRTSTLCDAPGFARRIEAAFREMWQRWCAAAEDGEGLASRP